jgi:multicomponent Na+:H+ antiporter subunit B
MIRRHESIVVVTFVRVLAPLTQVFALYVLVHGHDSPGGGFQAGVIMAAVYILRALALGQGADDPPPVEQRWLALAAAGALIYLMAGLVALPTGRAFLDYAAFPAATVTTARYLGILVIEIGVTVAVAASLILLFRRLAELEPRA